jgi:hypothetical protein
MRSAPQRDAALTAAVQDQVALQEEQISIRKEDASSKASASSDARSGRTRPVCGFHRT